MADIERVLPVALKSIIPAALLQKRKSLISGLADFWLMGGASIAIWVAMFGANFFRESSIAVQQRFLQLGVSFALLSLVCNHPHFIVSYRFGYGRGLRFVFQHWFALIAVPVTMIVLFTLAYFSFDADLCDGISCEMVNNMFTAVGLKIMVGNSSLGPEIMGFGIWVMYLTVGWHYAKQVYGCMMVYAHYDGYRLGIRQKFLIRWALLAVSIFQFVSATVRNELAASSGASDPRFPGIVLSPLGLPRWIFIGSELLVLGLSLAVVGVLIRNYFVNHQRPSVNFVTPWIAFVLWWASPILIPEFFLMIPFFHSLQYLPFAYEVEAKSIKGTSRPNLRISVSVLALLLAGFLAFEFIPGALDQKFDTEIFKLPLFFLTSFSLFLNIHHFFIDSVVWKFRAPEVRSHVLENAEPRTRTMVAS